MPLRPLAAALAAVLITFPALAGEHDTPAGHGGDSDPPGKVEQAENDALAAEASAQVSRTRGSVTVHGTRIDYTAEAGTLVVNGTGQKEHEPQVSMFYTAYFKDGAAPGRRPLTFVYNGGPGSATVWLHMGAFGPKRVVTRDDSHTPAAPYGLVDNQDSLMDATDLVFIDAPGAGFSRLLASDPDPDKRDKQLKDRQKDYYSVDGDAHAFARFITGFLSAHGRWNSPKYLFGESYGTTRSAVLANILENEDSVDLNGVVLLSQILNFDTSIDGPQANPGIDLPYALALPTYAATAYYHHALPQMPPALEPFLVQVEQFATGAYTQALMAGAALEPARRQAVAEQLHQYTGLPVAYLLKADLRVSGGMFEHALLSDGDTTTGRLDTRFQGPSLDPLGKEADYDPQSSALASAYIAAFNDYVRGPLKFGQGRVYREFADIPDWDFRHKLPGHQDLQTTTNVMPDLAMAMKTNPDLKVFVNGGYYDLATPFYAAQYEESHLPIPAALQKNISYAWYPSGHMVYAHAESLAALHDNVARFIGQTDNQAH